MSIYSYMEDVASKVRYWGIKGVVDYLRDFIPKRVHGCRLRRYFLRNARRFAMSPTDGVTIIADLTSRGSLNKVVRDLAFSLRDAGIPYQAFDTSGANDIPQQDVVEILTSKEEFRLLRYSRIITLLEDPLPPELGLRSSTLFFWEFATGVLHGYPGLKKCAAVVAMSEFNAQCFANVLPESVPVQKILYPFRFVDVSADDAADVRRRYGLKADDFVVFFNFDFGSSCNRKNPQGVIQAFADALRGVPNTHLVFKTKNAKAYPRRLAEVMSLARTLGISDQFTCVNDYIPQRDVYGLTAACDVYVSLHRGEGFGLGVIEAMSLGKPVVVTNYSATTEFCNAENSIPVPYRLVRPLPELMDHAYYVDVQEWAEPDVSFAQKAIRRLYDDPVWRKSLGEKARASIRAQFSVSAFRRSIGDFIRCDARVG